MLIKSDLTQAKRWRSSQGNGRSAQPGWAEHVGLSNIFIGSKEAPYSYHNHWPPLLRSSNLDRVDGGEKYAVADADEEAAEVDGHVGVHEHVEVPEVDEREAGGAGDADPGGQDGRTG